MNTYLWLKFFFLKEISQNIFGRKVYKKIGCVFQNLATATSFSFSQTTTHLLIMYQVMYFLWAGCNTGLLAANNSVMIQLTHSYWWWPENNNKEYLLYSSSVYINEWVEWHSRYPGQGLTGHYHQFQLIQFTLASFLVSSCW